MRQGQALPVKWAPNGLPSAVLPRVASRRSVRVKAELTNRGRAILPGSINVDRTLGEGSFGVVYQGQWQTPAGEQRVVLKRVKAKVEGAEQMSQMELLLNAHAAKVAKNHVADYIGYCQVAHEEATARLTPGLWLMWKFEGSRTLAYYLRRRDTLRALASDLEVAEEAVVATVMKQLFEGLAAFHAGGLVHRDIKPLNIIFAEQIKKFKLIDLGACADLRTGTNYCPDESILDPNYCPPEQYVLPTDSPHLSKSFLKLAISPMLWAQHKPDRFDMWSAGITLLQLSIPAMRQDRVLKRFNTDYGAKYDYDLDAWRAGSYINQRDFEVLDADGGAGWELAKSLLRPRSIRTLADNTVVFVNDNTLQRVSAGEALRHKFLKQAREPGSIMDEAVASSTGSAGRTGSGGSRAGSGGQRASSRPATASLGGAKNGSGGSMGAGRKGTAGRVGETVEAEVVGSGRSAGTFGAAVGLWRNLTSKLFDLEANIMVTASATEKQSTVVKKLQQKGAQSPAVREALAKEQNKLNNMEQQLGALQDDFNTTANAVGNVLGFLGFGPTKQASKSPSPPPRPQSPSGAGLTRSFGSMGSRDESDTPEPTGTSSSGGSSEGGTAGIWAAVQQKLSDLEMKLTNQSVATERQVFTVKKLRVAVKTGQVDNTTLSRAEAILERMERRVNELDQDLKQTRQEATGLLGLLASSVNQMRGGTEGSGGSASSRPEYVPGPATPAPTAQAALQASGMGGFFNRMFGNIGGGQAAKPMSATPPAAAPAAPAASAKGRGAAAARPVPPAVLAAMAAGKPQAGTPPAATPPPPTVAAAQSEGFGEGANNLIASSLRFTGMAAKVAMGMAAAMKADAEKVLKELEAEAEAKRVRKAAEQAFLRMLGAKIPPMETGTTFAEVEAAFGEDARYLAVEPSQRPLLVASFVDALQQAQQRTAEQAQAKLRDLISSGIKLDSTWEEIEAKYGINPAFIAVEDNATRRAVFDEVLAALKDAEGTRMAAGLAEQAFLDLLQEVQPPIAPDTTWPRVKPLLWRDFRYLAVPEPRRRELFLEMHIMVVEAAQAQDKAVEEKAAAQASSTVEILKDAAAESGKSTVNPNMLQELRTEQARLRSEYDAMERKLRDMEAALAAKERASSLLNERNPTPRAPSRAVTPRAPARAVTPTPAAKQSAAAASAAAAATAAATAASAAPAAPAQLEHAVAPAAAAVVGDAAKGQAAAGSNQNGGGGGSSVVPAGKGLMANARSTFARIVTPPLSRPRDGGQGGAGAAQTEAQVAESLQAAGVNYTRLKDGTLVFTFDGSDAETKSPSPSPSKATVNAGGKATV